MSQRSDAASDRSEIAGHACGELAKPATSALRQSHHHAGSECATAAYC